jgi:hypothetical protein
MCFNEIYIILCALVGKWKIKKYILSLSLELLKVGGYDFPQPHDYPRNSGLFLSGPQ